MNFVQVYGQTELCGAITALGADEHRDSTRQHLLLSAGKAAPGNEIRIVDPESGDQLPIGEPGEIWVRSNQRMSGYLNRPEATADTITADDWLRTGDIGRLDADGYLYIEDRLKDMIITGGENVYGPEVESVLIEHPADRRRRGHRCPRRLLGRIRQGDRRRPPPRSNPATSSNSAASIWPATNVREPSTSSHRYPATRAARSSKPNSGNRIGRTARGKV